jgi:CHAT domain-containing protein
MMALTPRADAKRILALSANVPATDDYDLLDLDSEFEDIKHEIRASEYRDYLEWHSIRAASVEGLINGICAIRPHILHFSGHGDRGELVLSKSGGRPRALKHTDLAEIVDALDGESLEILFLNACYSAIDLDQLNLSSVKAVVAMRDSIRDLYARKFAVAFYYALGSGRSVDVAVKAGQQILKCAKSGQQSIPDLIGRENPENYEPYLPVLRSGDDDLLQEVRLTPPESMTETAGYRYALLEVGPGWEKIAPEQIVNRRVRFEAEGSELVARVHQTRAGLQFKCYVEVPGDPPFLDELAATMSGVGWADPRPDGRYPNRFWFLVDDERAAPSAEGFINNYLRWTPV